MADLAALLEKEASAEIEAILAEARERASAIVADAEREAESLVASRERQAEARRRSELVRARSAAQLEAASMRLNAQQEAIESVFDRVEERIDEIANDDERYGPILEALLREALDGVRGSPEAIVVHPDDEELAKKAAKAVGTDAEIRTDDDVRAGVKVTTGTVSVENTLPGRLDALRDELASEVAVALSGEEA
jgi:vacuolar-type H+-ATPase subunit E/Vma4